MSSNPRISLLPPIIVFTFLLLVRFFTHESFFDSGLHIFFMVVFLLLVLAFVFGGITAEVTSMFLHQIVMGIARFISYTVLLLTYTLGILIPGLFALAFKVDRLKKDWTRFSNMRSSFEKIDTYEEVDFGKMS